MLHFKSLYVAFSGYIFQRTLTELLSALRLSVSAMSSTFLIGISLTFASAVPITLSVFSIKWAFLSTEISFLSIKVSFSSNILFFTEQLSLCTKYSSHIFLSSVTHKSIEAARSPSASAVTFMFPVTPSTGAMTANSFPPKSLRDEALTWSKSVLSPLSNPTSRPAPVTFISTRLLALSTG